DAFTNGVVTIDDLTDTTFTLISPVANGGYYWHVRAYNLVGDTGEYQAEPFSFMVDTEPPEFPSLMTPGGDSYTNDNTPLFSWTSTAGTGGTYLLEYTQDPAFTWTVSLPDLTDTFYLPTAVLDDGRWYWWVEATDMAGNPSGFQSSPATFTVDTEPPSIPALLSPTEGFFTNNDKPELVWGATAGEGGTYDLQYSQDITFTAGVVTETGLTDTAYSIPSSLSDGLWFWRVKALDFLKNSSEYQAVPGSFTVDTQPPDIPARYLPENLSYIAINTPQFAWSPTAGPNGSYLLKCTDDYLFQEFDVEIYDITDTTHTLVDPLEDGTWLWAVYAVDQAGNQSGYQAPMRFTVDTESPQIPELLTPTDNCCIKYCNPLFSWTSTSGASGRYTLQYSTDETFTLEVTTVESLEFNNYSPPSALTDDVWYWRVEAVDRVEHHSGFQPVPFSFRIDTQAPDVIVTSPPSGGIYTTMPSLTIFYEDDVDLAQGSYQIDDCTGDWTVIWSGFTGTQININWQVPEVALGPHDIYFRVTDDGGNTNLDTCITSWSFTYLPPCCIEFRGNVNCSEYEQPDISDITRLIDFLYLSHGPLCCPDEADCNASGGEPDISDITALIDHLYLSHKALPECP
ncbi:MAG: Ig-like domain-containing protein, partial [Candidatus Zixiibacteriota bacterium]